ncbi:Concanavalin A-like lectin/glucanases superfamily [Corchorus olitorius]|uniref:Concanavalin A-like lectin/glucanases superfamily n=1 Tax=Corchorus olitorius TaxID=93759 RepID=A0A1R3IM57_9ROSI|nr:Concanavalin A-like lectin/glucanases superfamily [Corchorus olitorius]
MAFIEILSLICLCLNHLISFQASAQLVNTLQGFTPVPLSESNFELHKPYDVAANQRYSYSNGEHRLWVYSTDKPHYQGSTTKPRTEIKIRGYDYSSGVWQFEGYVYVPSGTTGVCIMQTFGGSSRATTMMLRVYSGAFTYYRSPVLLSNAYNRWIRVNVIHDVGASNVKIYLDQQLRYEGAGAGGTSHYFKFGVYAQNDESNYMESRWLGIKVLRKN